VLPLTIMEIEIAIGIEIDCDTDSDTDFDDSLYLDPYNRYKLKIDIPQPKSL